MTKNFVKSAGILVAIVILAACMIATAVQGNLAVAAGLFIAFICTAVFVDSTVRAAKFNAIKYAKLEAINEDLNEETNKYRVNAANAQKALDELHVKYELLQTELRKANVKLNAAIDEQNKLSKELENANIKYDNVLKAFNAKNELYNDAAANLKEKTEKLETAEQTLDDLRADIASKAQRIAALEQSYNEMVELANKAAKKAPAKRAVKKTAAKKATVKKTED
jgi:chromosome segregation ATPase